MGLVTSTVLGEYGNNWNLLQETPSKKSLRRMTYKLTEYLSSYGDPFLSVGYLSKWLEARGLVAAFITKVPPDIFTEKGYQVVWPGRFLDENSEFEPRYFHPKFDAGQQRDTKFALDGALLWASEEFNVWEWGSVKRWKGTFFPYSSLKEAEREHPSLDIAPTKTNTKKTVRGKY